MVYLHFFFNHGLTHYHLHDFSILDEYQGIHFSWKKKSTKESIERCLYPFLTSFAQASFNVTVLLKTSLLGVLSLSIAKYPLRKN